MSRPSANAGAIYRYSCQFNPTKGTTLTIDPAVIGILNQPGVLEYFTRNPHRLAACRALLDLLSIPLPDWAARDISGRAAATRNAMTAFRADNPETLAEATARKTGRPIPTAQQLFG